MTVEYDDNADELIFSSGNRLYVHNGVIGISLSDYSINGRLLERFLPSYGGDGGLPVQPEKDFTKADMHELADAMIKRWLEFKNAIDGRKSE